MDISVKKSEDNTTAVVKMVVKEEDYYPSVEKSLRSVRQNLEMDGFRKGKVPYEIVRAKYEVPYIIQSTEKLIDEKLYAYLGENKIKIIGSPIADESQQKEIDWKKDREYEFYFEIALCPEVNVSLSKEDTLTRFKVKVTDELVNNEIELGKKRFGHSEHAEKMTPDAFLKGDIQELDENGEEKEKGLKTEGVTVYPMYFRVEEQRALFDDKCVGDTVVFNPYEATDGSETELEYMLKVDRLDVVKYKGNFKFTIKEIQAFVPSNVDKMFFMQMLEGRKDVEDEETFRKELAKIMESRFEEQSQAMLEAGARKLLIEKAGDLPLSVDFFKRLAKSKNEKLTDEQANEHIPEQMDTIKWSIVRGHIQEDINVKIDQKDIIEEAKKRIATQFKMIGIPVEDDKALEDRALKLLKGGEFTEELASGILDRAIGNWAIEQVTVKDEEVLPERFLEEFAKLGNLAL